MKPTIGRIVITHTQEYGDVPGIISVVNEDDNCKIHVFCSDGVRIMDFNHSDSPKPNSWTWPIIEKQEDKKPVTELKAEVKN